MNDICYFEDLELGSTLKSACRTITETDIVNFAGLSGDFNLLHTDAEFAKTTIFGERIAHGLLGLAICSGLPLPIPPVAVMAFMGVEWKFTKPILIGDTIHFENVVKNRREMSKRNGGIVVMERTLKNQKDEVVQKGTFTLMIQMRPKEA